MAVAALLLVCRVVGATDGSIEKHVSCWCTVVHPYNFTDDLLPSLVQLPGLPGWFSGSVTALLDICKVAWATCSSAEKQAFCWCTSPDLASSSLAPPSVVEIQHMLIA